MEDSPEYQPQSAYFTPGYSSSIRNAAKQFTVFWKPLVLISLLDIIIGYLLQIPNYIGIFSLGSTTSASSNPIPALANSGWNFLFQAFVIIVTLALGYGLMYVNIKAARNEKPSIVDLFRPFQRLIPVIISGLLMGLIIGIGFLLLIIPGIIFACRLAFVPYLVIDQKLGTFASIRRSWEMTKRHFWKIFLLGLTVMGIGFILGFAYLIVIFTTSGNNIFQGNLPNIWMYQIIYSIVYLPISIFILLTFGSLYNAIHKEDEPQQINSLEATPPNVQIPLS